MVNKTKVALSLAARLVVGTLFAAVSRQVADVIIATAILDQKIVNAILGLLIALVFAFLIFPLFKKNSVD